MLARYRAVYAVRTIGLPSGSASDVEITRQDDPWAVACLVSDPLPYCQEIFTWGVLAEGMLKGMFCGRAAPLPHDVPEVARQKAADRLASLPSNCAYVVVDGFYEIETPNFRTFRDAGPNPFGAAFHDTLGPEITDRFSGIVHRALGAIHLAAAEGDSPRLEKVGERAFLLDPESNKPIYLFRAQAGTATLYGMRTLTEQTAGELRTLAAVRPHPYDPSRSLKLLTNADENRDDALVSFVSSWSALEIFVGGLFAERYATTPPQSKREPPLRRRFEVIATDLNSANARADLALFDDIYRVRNALFHEAFFVDLRQPSHDAQKLARKYIRLYYGTVPP
ncbi:hypothetical protein [Falsiroseomonas oryzae]|uniref:hypothetical protein n=1 Tax=Falsiroseomonas oryzae TaxID=2766473 RepID=UPI0022EAD3CD|nr:hypothetical protein [Roseomonas sp. MO-31]